MATKKGHSIWDDLLVPGFSTSEPENWASTKAKQQRELEMKSEKIEMIVSQPDVETNGLYALAAALGAYFQKTPKQFMLSEPRQLTVKKKDGSFSKRPHIGGESFKPVSAYVGKKDTLIFMLSPAEVADYIAVEMSEAETKSLPGFDAYLKNMPGGFGAAISEAKKSAAAASELAKNAEKFETYADIGFGTF